MRVSWTVRRSNQSILKEICPEYSLEGLMLKLKLQYFDHMMQRTDSLEKTANTTEIQKIRRKCCEQFGNLEEVDEFLEIYTLSKLNQEKRYFEQTNH